MRYPEEALLTKDPSALLNADDPVASEQEAVRRALEMEVAEVESAYSDGRLAAIVYGSRVAAPPCSNVSEVEGLLNLEEVDRLCDEDMALEARGERGLTQPLERLARFVATGEGVLGARRNAVAYIGGTGGRGGAVVFEAVASTFQTAKAAGLRRTAGDALSDLGDPRAVPLAAEALADSTALVRWRAARILGELGEADGGSTVAALNQAALQERAFEVSFELREAARKVQLRAEGADGGARGPAWKQIQEGGRA
jgi:HEAT repeat protein